MKPACLVVGAALLATAACTPRPTALEKKLRLLQNGDRWVYHRSNMLNASDVTVQITDVQELGQGVRELTLRLSWQENIMKRVPDKAYRSGYATHKVGERPAWHFQKMRQGSDGTLLWVGAGSTSEYTRESGNAQPDDPNTGIEPLFLGLEQGLLMEDRRERSFPVASTSVGVESIQLSYRVVGVELVTTKRGTVQGIHISGVQTQEMRGGKTWKIFFDDWYDGHRLLLKRTFTVDSGHAVLGMKILLGGTWTFKAFYPAAGK